MKKLFKNMFSSNRVTDIKGVSNSVVQVNRGGKSHISVNGKSYVGNNVTVAGNKVYIDGKLSDDEDSKEITIIVDGNIDKLDVDVADFIRVNGNVNSVKTISGDVEVYGDCSGNVKTMSGDVECKSIAGDVETMSGDIN